MSWIFITITTIFFLSFSEGIVQVQFPSYAPGPALNVYSGYVTVDERAGRSIHYILVKAETDPDTKPLVVWYQGGPGCSGLYALFGENGPFNIIRAGPGMTSVVYNNLGWTKFANMLYVEQPAFVGFSYSNNQSDIMTSDKKAAMDNYMFLELFMETQFPEFNGRDLWFTGESYGGVYVPMLSSYVVSNPATMLYKQFKGFMIGNPVFSCQNGLIGESAAYAIEDVHNLYWHGLVSYTNYYNWTQQGCNDPNNVMNPSCQYIYNLIGDQLGEIVQEKRGFTDSMNWPSVDPDDLFQDFCTGNGSLTFIDSPTPDDPVNTCNSEIGDLITEYLNRPEVQYALAVIPTQWQVCSELQYDFDVGSMVDFYLSIFQSKPSIKILIYSGDLDILTVPFGYTQPCLSQMSNQITSAWQPWFVNGVTAGYVETYDKFTYATIKGAGHEAPLYQPVSSYQLIYRFLTAGSLEDRNPRPVRKSRSYKSQSDMLRHYGLLSRLSKK